MQRLPCLFIALFIMINLLCSCGGANAPDKKIDTDINTDSVAETSEKEITDNIPGGITFNGETINVLEFDRTAEAFIYAEIYSEGETGEIVNDAVFRRNTLIESRFDIIIKSVLCSRDNVAPQAEKSVLADDKSYDVFDINVVTTAKLLSGKMLVDIRTIPYVELFQPWWDQKAEEAFSVVNKLFLAINSANLTAIHHNWSIVFNKAVIENNGLETPYQFVRDGKWTLDKMYSMIKDSHPRDLNGDGVMDEYDMWGLTTQTPDTLALFYGSGEKMFSKDADDIPYITMNTPRATDVLDKVFDIMFDKSVTATAGVTKFNDNSNPWGGAIAKIIREDRTLFHAGSISYMSGMRDKASDFGFLPIPKFNEAQDDYHNIARNYYLLGFGVPVTNAKMEATGAFLETIGCESYKSVVPVYYETSVKNKLVRDEESIEMLELIRKSRSYDLGTIFNWGGCTNLYTDLTIKADRNFASAYGSIEKRINAEMENFINDILSN